MSLHEASIPWRILAFSAALVTLLAVAGWLTIASRSRGPEPQRSADARRGPEELVGPPATESAEDAAAGVDVATPPENAAPQPEGGVGSEEGQAVRRVGQPEFLTAAASERAAEGTMIVHLFLVVPGLESLIPVSRKIAAPLTLEAQAQRALEELIAWTGNEMVSPLPPQAIVREVWVSASGIAYVDFDIGLTNFLAGGTLAEIHAVYSVVHTVTSSFPEIRAVQILVDASEVDTLSGHIDLSRPLLPLAEWVINAMARRSASR